MNKSQLVTIVAGRLDLPKTTAEAAVAAVLDTIQTAVAKGERVSLTGFGAFEAVHRPGRFGRNPQTGEPLEIAESWAPKFKAGAEFKAAVATSRQGTSSMTPPCPL